MTIVLEFPFSLISAERIYAYIEMAQLNFSCWGNLQKIHSLLHNINKNPRRSIISLYHAVVVKKNEFTSTQTFEKYRATRFQFSRVAKKIKKLIENHYTKVDQQLLSNEY